MQTMTSRDIDQVAGGAVMPLATFLGAVNLVPGYGDPATLSEAIRIAELQKQVREESAAALASFVAKMG